MSILPADHSSVTIIAEYAALVKKIRKFYKSGLTKQKTASIIANASCGRSFIQRIAHGKMLLKRGGKKMEIRVGENESLESALKRWKRKCARSGVLAEVRRREHYEKPSVKRKKKAEAARKRKY